MFTSKKILAAALTFLSVGVSSSYAETLRYAHFMPASSWQNEKLFNDWAKSVAEASAGDTDVKVFPAQTLGKAPAGYDNAASGVADIAWTVQGYTAGRFPLSQIVELPGLFETAETGSCAFQKLYDSGALDEEYKDTHVLFVHTHGLGHIHTRGKPVKSLDDLKGLKLRRPTTVIGTLLSELGAEPVGMPAPAIFEAVQRGTIDGYLLPWEAVSGFRLDEVTDYRTDFGFYSLAFVATMNKAKYEALPASQKAAIDANSGMKWAMIAGRGYDDADKVAKEKLGAGLEQFEISEEERVEWEAAAQRATQSYLSQLDDSGLPGTKTYEAFKTYVEECEGA